MTGPAPSYMTSPNGAAQHASAVRNRLESAVNDRLRAVLIDAAAECGATVVDVNDQTISDDGLAAAVTVDAPGYGRADLALPKVTVRPTIPPGWIERPRFARGQVLNAGWLVTDATGAPAEAVVLAVLGTRDDPRPGYRMAGIARRQDQSFDVSGLGSVRVVPASLVDGGAAHIRDVGVVDLPDNVR